MTVHQPEVRAASGVRNEVTMIPRVGISHGRQSTSRTILTTGVAAPWPAPGAPARRGAARLDLAGTGVDPDAVTAVLAGLAGYLVRGVPPAATAGAAHPARRDDGTPSSPVVVQFPLWPPRSAY